MIYATIYQLSKATALVEATTVSANDNAPSADTLVDSANGFVSAGFQDGDTIQVSGFANSANNGEFEIDTVTAGTITLTATASLVNEVAGATVTIRKKRIAKVTATGGGEYQGDEWYDPFISRIGPVSLSSESGYSRLVSGSITVMQAELSEWELEARNVNVVANLSDTGDSLFSGDALVTDWNPDEITVEFKSADLTADLLSQAPDINTTATYTDGRYLPKAFGRQTHKQPLLLDDTNLHYHSGDAVIEHVYDDGVAVEFQGVSSSYATSADDVQYAGLAYRALVNPQTKSPTGGATSNSDWSYLGSASGEQQFQCSMGTGTYTAGSFQLVANPAGTVTFSGVGANTKFTDVMNQLVTMLGLTLDTTNADTAVSTQINHWVTNQQSILQTMQEFATFHEHIFRASTTTVTLIDRDEYETEHTLGEDDVELGGDKILFHDLVKRFRATWKTSYARANPQEITEEEHSVTVTTDNLEGRDVVVKVFDDDAGRITTYLQKKRDLDNNFVEGEIVLVGVRTEILPGDRVGYSGEFGAGDMFIDDVTVDVEGNTTTGRGIIENLVRA